MVKFYIEILIDYISFLTYNYSKFNNQNYNPINPATFNVNANANLQIDYIVLL